MDVADDNARVATAGRRPRWAWRVALLAAPALAWCGVPAASDYYDGTTLAVWPGTRFGAHIEQGCLLLGDLPSVPDVGDLFVPRRLPGSDGPGESAIYVDIGGPRVDRRFDALLALGDGLEAARERGVRWVTWSGGGALAISYDWLLWGSHGAALPLLVGAWRERQRRRHHAATV